MRPTAGKIGEVYGRQSSLLDDWEISACRVEEFTYRFQLGKAILNRRIGARLLRLGSGIWGSLSLWTAEVSVCITWKCDTMHLLSCILQACGGDKKEKKKE